MSEKKSNKKTLIFVGFGIFILLLVLSSKNKNSNNENNTDVNKANTSNTVQSNVTKRYTILSGIEKDKNSPSYGQLVVETINLWENAGSDRGKVVVKIPHDTKVEILEENDTDQKYYRVVDSNNNQGWVSEQFITDITSE